MGNMESVKENSDRQMEGLKQMSEGMWKRFEETNKPDKK